jgi:hypothetical protein
MYTVPNNLTHAEWPTGAQVVRDLRSKGSLPTLDAGDRSERCSV